MCDCMSAAAVYENPPPHTVEDRVFVWRQRRAQATEPVRALIGVALRIGGELEQQRALIGVQFTIGQCLIEPSARVAGLPSMLDRCDRLGAEFDLHTIPPAQA